MFKKLSYPALAVAFVWFTTHFGGGFASGRQVVEFYVKFGWYAAIMPIVAMGIMAVVFYYALDFSFVNKTYDYAGWAKKFYPTKFGTILFEISYILLLLVASAVAFATGGATLRDVLGTPYVLNTVFIALAIYFLTIYGADVVRKSATVIAIVIIVGVVGIYGVNVIVSFPDIVKIIGSQKTDVSFFPVIKKAIMYAGFQVIAFGSYVSVADAFKERKDAKRAAVYGFIINAVILTLVSLGILAYYPTILPQEVPTVFVAQNGVGGNFATFVVSFLILLGVVSTGVNLVYGGTKRIVAWWNLGGDFDTGRKKSKIASGIYVIITWGIALFGLIPLIAKGYGYLGYVGILLFIIPVLIIGIKAGGNWKSSNSKS